MQAAYDAANEQIQFNSSSPNLTYDANGNLTNDGTNTYTWDARNRLIAQSGPGVSASFSYDALGRRTRKTINGGTTSYLYDGNDIVQEIGGGSVGASYLRGLKIDEAFVRQSSGNEFYHSDALGSVLALTGQTGAVQTKYNYEAFGKTTITGTSINPFQYTGRENDGTGLYYYRARFFSVTAQRFISEDPIGLFGGDTNLYAYVLNNPTRFVDQLGLDWFRPPSEPYVVGRPGTLVEPGEWLGKFIEDYVPAMHTLGIFHDQLVDMGVSVGLPDWLINIPTMPGMYVIAVETELYNNFDEIRQKMRDRGRGLGRRKG